LLPALLVTLPPAESELSHLPSTLDARFSAVAPWVAQSSPPLTDTPSLELSPEPTIPEPEPLPPLPPPDELLPLPDLPEGVLPGLDIPGTVTVQAFRVVGSTVFSAEELAAATAPFMGRPITFTELLEARSAITQLYIDAGYITTGAFVPADQVIDAGVVEIRVVEGFLEQVVVEGREEFVPGYISSRIAYAAGQPLNVNRLVAGLQLLQLSPLIETISAELASGTQVGGSIVNVQIQEAPSFQVPLAVDNSRSPTVGTVRRQLGIRDRNLLGFGDALELTYSNSEGSDTVDFAYTVPVSPTETTVGVRFSQTRSNVIDEDFEILGIESESRDLQVTLRQPLYRTPTTDFTLGLEFSRSRSESTFQLPGTPRLGFPFTGAPDGEATVTAVRFLQEWTQRSADRAIAARSVFSVGTSWFDATQNPGDLPDSNFLSWQGQAQWVEVLSSDTVLLARLNGQLADRPLLSLEQFRLGGQGSVRGYREDRVTADNGVFASLEVRVPILEIPQWESLVQLAPFVDYGYAWNSGDRAVPEPQSLFSVGAGAIWQWSDRVTARLDYGIPLINDDGIGDSLQESGLLFSISGQLF